MGESWGPEQMDRFARRAVSWFRAGGSGISVRTFERDRPIYLEGTAAKAIFCLDSGYVKLLGHMPDGRESVLALQGAGELFGELCICGQPARRESAHAVSQVTVRCASPPHFLEFVVREGLIWDLVHYLAERLVLQQRSIAILLLENSQRRLAHTLLALSGKGDREGSILIRLSHEELGGMIGTTRTRVGQFLKHFREIGLVHEFGRDGVRIDRARLQAYCG